MKTNFRTLETPPLSTNHSSLSNLGNNKRNFDKLFFKKSDTYQRLSQQRLNELSKTLRRKLLPNFFSHTAQKNQKTEKIKCPNFKISRRPKTQILCFFRYGGQCLRSRPIRLHFHFKRANNGFRTRETPTLSTNHSSLSNLDNNKRKFGKVFFKNLTQTSQYLGNGRTNYQNFFAENFCQTFSSVPRKNFGQRTKLSAPILKSPVDQKHRFCVFSVL